VRKERKMLFITIMTWEPAKRDEVRKRWAEKGKLTGGKILGQWSTIEGGRTFRLAEVEDPKGAVLTCNAWNDIAELEVIPVIETEELMKLVSKK
jgi:hypothetical protein